MSYNLHILKSSGRLEPFSLEIKKIAKDVLDMVQKKIKISEVDIVIVDQPDGVIPETGLGGYSPNKNLLYVYTDPGRINFNEILQRELSSTIAHELHHCARWQTIDIGENLLEAMVSEGLADHFAIEINGGSPPPWSVALKAGTLGDILEKARISFFDKEYNHSEWFFGTNKEIVPRWAGYSLGYYIVDEYLKKTGKKSSDLVATKADFLK